MGPGSVGPFPPDPMGVTAGCLGEAVCPQRPRVPASLSLVHGLSALWPLSTQLKGQGQPAEAAAALPLQSSPGQRGQRTKSEGKLPAAVHRPPVISEDTNRIK